GLGPRRAGAHCGRPPRGLRRPLEMLQLLQRVRHIRLARYMAASVVAPGADMGSFLVLLALGVFAAGASAAGYCLGILVHWLVSSRKVFDDTLAASGPARTRQKLLFVISAL